MKAILLSMMIALAAQQCREDHDEDYEMVRTEDEIGYVAEDLIRREAIAKWEQFLTDSHKQLDRAEKEVTMAMDRLEEPGTKNKLLLEVEIINAEGMLEQLCEKLDRGSRFDGIDLSDDNIARMNHFMADYKKKEEKLKKVLSGLQSKKFKK